jgi:hypothetical protein
LDERLPGIGGDPLLHPLFALSSEVQRTLPAVFIQRPRPAGLADQAVELGIPDRHHDRRHHVRGGRWQRRVGQTDGPNPESEGQQEQKREQRGGTAHGAS